MSRLSQETLQKAYEAYLEIRQAFETPEGRVRYKSYHRKQDIELLLNNWPTHNEKTVPVDEVSSSMQKKLKKVLKANFSYWESLHKEQGDMMMSDGNVVGYVDDKVSANMVKLAEEASNSINKLVPKVDGKLVIDITQSIRTDRDGWQSLRRSGFGFTYYFLLYQSMISYFGKPDRHDTIIAYCERIFDLFPVLTDKAPIPHPCEVVILQVRAETHLELGDFKSALDDFQSCGAAVRLLNYHRDEEHKDDMELLDLLLFKKEMKKSVLTALVRAKVVEKASRPLFSVDEINKFEKQWGMGIFHHLNYKCHHCGKSRSVGRLVLCSGCNRAWVCDENCHRAGWKAHKKLCRCLSHRKAWNVDQETYDEQFELLLKYDVICFEDEKKSIYAHCIDADTGNWFDAWSDRNIVVDEIVTEELPDLRKAEKNAAASTDDGGS